MKNRILLFCLFAPLLIATNCKQANPEPFIHSVYFWFNEDMTEDRLAEFKAATLNLKNIEVVEALYIGTAAETFRPIVERSYDLAVIVHFKNLAAHDAYQQHPTHLALLEEYGKDWEKVMITDME